MRVDMYEAFTAYEEQRAARGEKLCAEAERLVQRMIRDFKRNGLALPADKREKVGLHYARPRRPKRLSLVLGISLSRTHTLILSLLLSVFLSFCFEGTDTRCSFSSPLCVWDAVGEGAEEAAE